MAKKIIAKSKQREGEVGRTREGEAGKAGRDIRQPGMFVTSQSKHPIFPQPAQRMFNGSEGDLSLAYNSVGGGAGGGPACHTPQSGRAVRYTPEGRCSPEVQVYKTRVIYHSRQDCLADHEASV